MKTLTENQIEELIDSLNLSDIRILLKHLILGVVYGNPIPTRCISLIEELCREAELDD